MLFVSVTDPNLLSQIPQQVDGIELRLDLMSNIDVEAIKEYTAHSRYPILYTLRKRSHGGSFKGSELEREELIEKYLELEPDFFDLECDMRPVFLERVFHSYPQTRFILSYHNFRETPLELEAIYKTMTKYSVYGYKIAVQALSTNDALRLLLFGSKHSQLSVISMGERGEFGRVLGPVIGNLMDYACVNANQKTAPGQLSINELIDVYGYHKLNSKTHLYGLIGDPVSSSKGHIFHNSIYQNSVYVKMNVKVEELAAFLLLAKEIGFKGLSVTMPLKEQVIPFLDSIDFQAKEIGAVNTVLIKNRQLFGYNTDGLGALDAIEKRVLVRGKKIVLIGAGGTAKAIAFEAKRRGADVVILNRTVHKAKELALKIGCQAGELSDMPGDYDVLVNCSPDLSTFEFQKILPSALIMDVVYFPHDTPLLQKAVEIGCKVIYGEEMFINQATAQIQLGFGD